MENINESQRTSLFVNHEHDHKVFAKKRKIRLLFVAIKRQPCQLEFSCDLSPVTAKLLRCSGHGLRAQITSTLRNLHACKAHQLSCF